MKILQLDTERTWRGGEQQMVSMCRGLAARGHENVAAVRKDGALRERLREDRVEFLFVRPWSECAPFSAAALRSHLLKNRVDVIHAHTAHAVALAAVATLGTSIPIVATRRVDFHLSRGPLSRWKYSRVDRFIAVSRCVRKILMQDGVSGDRVSVIPDAVDFDRFSSVTPVSRTSLGFPADAILVGSVAALVPHKDPETFVRAVGLLHGRNPRVRGIIFGEGALRPGLEALIRRLKLEGVVRLPGFRKDVLNCLAAFDVFTLSSVEEGLGTSLLDAMALGVPVAATDAGGIPEVVDHEITGLLSASRDPASLAHNIERILSDATLRAALVAQAREKCREFDITRLSERIEQVYEATLLRR